MTYKTKILDYIITCFDTPSPHTFNDLVEFRLRVRTIRVRIRLRIRLRVRSAREEILV